MLTSRLSPSARRLVLALVLVAVCALLFWRTPLSSPSSSSSSSHAPPRSLHAPYPLARDALARQSNSHDDEDETDHEPHWSRAMDAVLFNPLEPSIYRPHHRVFESFKRWSGPFNAQYVTDWLGIQTKYSWDCVDDPSSTMHYSIIQPSRRLPCEIHAAQRKAGAKRIAGEMPLVDDEYEEMIDVLSSVVRTPRDYVMVELGARYGTWGVRGLKAWHQLRGPHAKATYVGVESSDEFFAWMTEHVEHNNLTAESVLLHQRAERSAGSDLRALVAKAGIDHINYLDTDIQSAEGDFFDHEPTLAWMDEHVDCVHIGTHSERIHERLQRLFDARGWVYLFGYPLGYSTSGLRCDAYLVDSLQTRAECLSNSPYGKLYVRDGMLSYGNPKLFAPDADSP